MKIGLNPGHDTDRHCGAENHNYLVDEGHVVHSIGQMLKALLETAGHEVIFVQKDNLCGEAPYYDKPNSVVGILNAAGTRFNISLHCNAWEGPDDGAKGTETFYWHANTEGKKLAGIINRKLVELGFADRGAKPDQQWGFLKKTDATSVLVEIGFIRNPDDIKLLFNGQNKIAYAIYEAINEFIGGM